MVEIAWDLAISPYGDLLFAGNRDLMGVGEGSLMEQRVRLRCKITRGSWVYDETKTLGSHLWKLVNATRLDIVHNADPYVREALVDMDDISVGEIEEFTREDEAHRHLHVRIEFTPVDNEVETNVNRQILSTTVLIS